MINYLQKFVLFLKNKVKFSSIPFLSTCQYYFLTCYSLFSLHFPNCFLFFMLKCLYFKHVGLSSEIRFILPVSTTFFHSYFLYISTLFLDLFSFIFPSFPHLLTCPHLNGFICIFPSTNFTFSLNFLACVFLFPSLTRAFFNLSPVALLPLYALT